MTISIRETQQLKRIKLFINILSFLPKLTTQGKRERKKEREREREREWEREREKKEIESERERKARGNSEYLREISND